VLKLLLFLQLMLAMLTQLLLLQWERLNACEGCCLLASHASCLLLSLVQLSHWPGGHDFEMAQKQAVKL
jgi:hypothetical protein